jgi:hypothetical protein
MATKTKASARAELDGQIGKPEPRVPVARRNDAGKAIADIRKAIALYGLTPADLGLGKAAAKKTRRALEAVIRKPSRRAA